MAALLLAGGCASPRARVTRADPPSRTAVVAAIRGALRYLDDTQLRKDRGCPGSRDWEGNWPQYRKHGSNAPGPGVREVSPFMVTFVHHALSHISPQNAAALSLEPADLDAARKMRSRAAAFLQRFEVSDAGPVSGTYGFWPQRPGTLGTPKQLFVLSTAVRRTGPPGAGILAPANPPLFPKALWSWPDADTFATVSAAVAERLLIDGDDASPTSPARLLAAHRDVHAVNLRFPPWREDATGAYMTWLVPDGTVRKANDVCLVVNANCLYALGLSGELGCPGSDEATAFIVNAIEDGHHRATGPASLYYPEGYTLHYAVSRAFREGPVPGLAPAVEVLADEVTGDAVTASDGTVFWRSRTAHLESAQAILTLLNAGRGGPIVEGGIRHLLREQREDGSWRWSNFAVGGLARAILAWRSEAYTTALALEAMARHVLATQQPGPGTDASPR